MTEVVVVTGGGRGIGRAASLLAAERGYAVALSYRQDRVAAEQVVATIAAGGGRATAIACEVSEEAQVCALFREAAVELGPITAVVNNAGIVAPSLPLVELTAERLRRMFEVNVFGAYLVAREAARAMARSRGGQGGALVNVSSIAARLGSPNEYVDYAGSKAAVDTLTVGLAKELAGDGVRVNAVRPGLIETEIHGSAGQPDRAQRLGAKTPIGRPGSAKEVANVILWLLGDEASYVTGALFDVSGGR
jgi:NAD(P)-dependent dehydrogenase (short-subunit alcohol dehydrogenase family)